MQIISLIGWRIAERKLILQLSSFLLQFDDIDLRVNEDMFMKFEYLHFHVQSLTCSVLENSNSIVTRSIDIKYLEYSSYLTACKTTTEPKKILIETSNKSQ